MFRLGLQLTLRSGREGLVRLLITAAAVAVGVALLLGVLAEFHAFQANANQPCWSCTQGAPVPGTLPAHGELWNNSVDFYQGQTISRLDVAALGPGAPVPPGITQLPPAGDYYASPALAALLRTVPADELGARFPGRLIGTIGQAGLDGAGDLAIYIGHTPAQANAIPGTTWVTSISSAPAQEVFSPFFRYAFGVGVLAVLFPLLVLISTATRLAADRREERFAALRLVGGTPGDIRIVAVGRGHAQRVPRRGDRNGHLPAGPAGARRGSAGRHAVLRVGADADHGRLRRDARRRAGRRGRRRAGVAAPGAGLPARRQPARHAEAADVLAADRARDRRRRLPLRAGQDLAGTASARPPTPGSCSR